MSFTLTRLLYSHDEVKYSLINSLLQKKNITECYFWCTELYYSDSKDELHIFDFIWKIYFDFYAIYNPSLEKYIQKKEKIWRDKKELTTLIYIIYNLYHCNISSEVFILRQNAYIEKDNFIIYNVKGRKWNWLNDFPAVYRNFVIAIHKKHIINASTILYKLVQSREVKEIYNILIRYYQKHIPLQSSSTIDIKWKRHHWPDNFHGLLAMLVHLETPIEKITHPLVFKQPSKTTIDMLIQHNKDIESRHKHSLSVYRILSDFRMFTINEMIGVFNLNRYSVPNFKNENRQYWEYYAYHSPLWRDRIKFFGGTFQKKDLVFINKTYKEKDFYDNYGLELDEQCEETQLRSLCDIPEVTIQEWHEKIFMFPALIKLDQIVMTY